ncbi:hypothetical protein LUU34_01395800 [Aix galericulata]|nr:hypothetical protein LUU34_01395800 [Aix galericulata]
MESSWHKSWSSSPLRSSKTDIQSSSRGGSHSSKSARIAGHSSSSRSSGKVSHPEASGNFKLKHSSKHTQLGGFMPFVGLKKRKYAVISHRIETSRPGAEKESEQDPDRAACSIKGFLVVAVSDTPGRAISCYVAKKDCLQDASWQSSSGVAVKHGAESPGQP